MVQEQLEALASVDDLLSGINTVLLIAFSYVKTLCPSMVKMVRHT